ncbi:SGNH/GDSL hydrolase family protein [Prescottella sp. R16]|uniref:SGNH/GDSL hydrolase family protein n=1 Tax=Prescottella sp. R16 TaxID=3064529 RepID=UPI00272E0896|nr:SGNH/GDSL hydrolase family protein [Prescottella sp. R16]
MRVKTLRSAVMAATVAIGMAGLPTVAAATPGEGPTYYLALGDSLAAGYQPDTGHDEPVSYTDDIYAALKQTDPNLEFVDLGCDGETTETMIDGGKCAYPGAASQLDAATKFLEEHRGKVEYVTENIGANDVYHCLSGGAGSLGSSGVPDVGCITQALATVERNLTTINSRLRDTGGDEPRYVGMNYYDPALAGWLEGGPTRVVAAGTAALNNLFAATITTTNSSAGFATADVLTAFSNNDFTPVDVPGFGTLPTNVGRICEWTWMCTQYRDIHANPTGHQVIADTFLPLLEDGSRGSLGSSGSPGSSGSLGSGGQSGGR